MLTEHVRGDDPLSKWTVSDFFEILKTADQEYDNVEACLNQPASPGSEDSPTINAEANRLEAEVNRLANASSEEGQKQRAAMTEFMDLVMGITAYCRSKEGTGELDGPSEAAPATQ